MAWMAFKPEKKQPVFKGLKIGRFFSAPPFLHIIVCLAGVITPSVLSTF